MGRHDGPADPSMESALHPPLFYIVNGSVTVKLVPPKSGPMGPNIISELVPQTKYNMLTGPRGTNNNIIHGPPS